MKSRDILPLECRGLYEVCESSQDVEDYAERLEKALEAAEEELMDNQGVKSMKTVTFDLDNLEESLLACIKPMIDSVLSGEQQSVQLPFARPSHVFKYLGIDDPDIQTNGWEWDYRVYINISGVNFKLFGDGYFNLTCTFERVISDYNRTNNVDTESGN